MTVSIVSGGVYSGVTYRAPSEATAYNVFNAASMTFYAPLQFDLRTSVATDGTITFTRATAAWDFDDQGYLIDLPSGCARFTGARALYNRIPQSENLSTWSKTGSCTVTGSKTDPNGGSTAYQIDNISTDGVDNIYYGVTTSFLTFRTPLYVGFWIKKVSSSGTISVRHSAGTGIGRWNINLTNLPSGWTYVDHTSPYISIVSSFIVSSNGTIGFKVVANTSGPFSIQLWGVQIYHLSHVNQTLTSSTEYVSSGVLSAPFHGAAANGVKFFPDNASGNRISDSTMKGVLIEGARTNNLKYCRNLAFEAGTPWVPSTTGSNLITNGDFPSDLSGWTNISSGTATATWSSGKAALVGTDSSNRGGIEQTLTLTVGKQYYCAITVVRTSGDLAWGWHTSSGVGTTTVIQGLGGSGTYYILIKPTQATIYFKIYTQSGGGNFTVDDFTCYETTINANLNATGICNQANSCTTLTAAANDATILQQFTLASAARSFSAYVKRKTGTGTISITRDGGSTWTDVTSQINSSTFTRVSILNTSVTNPNCGFKIATSGDEIIVDCCQDEAGLFASTPIITTTATVTRNADSLTYPVANLHATKNTVYHEAITGNSAPEHTSAAGADRRSIIFTASTNNRLMYYYVEKYARYGTGSAVVATGTATYTLNMAIKNIIRWENGNPGSLFVNGVKCTDTASNVSVTPTTIDIGATSSSVGLYGNIKNVRIWPNTLLTDAQCIQLTS